MPDYAVLKQNSQDSWDELSAAVTADTPEGAIEMIAKDEGGGGEGRYVAIPNEWWTAQEVTIRRIASVNMKPFNLR
jgi:hypothetical protein